MKFERLFKSKEYLPTSLVAEEEAGRVVGFVMGELYMGEFGIFQEQATLADRKDLKLSHFFSANPFSPSQTINLERNL